MKIIFIAAVLSFVSGFAVAQVGIGTTTPSTNAALDITSANKGLMLPRVNDTGVVTNPTAGLIIYNKATKSPAFHNGNQWSTLATQAATTEGSGTDSITYTITNATNGFVNGTYQVSAISNGASNPNTGSSTTTVGPSNFSDLSFAKPMDVNSTAFSKAVATGVPLGAMIIEFKMFVKGDLTPYYSIKCTNFWPNSFNLGLSTSGGGFTEQVTISPEIFGYKNWVNNLSFSYNIRTRVAGAY